MQLKSLYIKDYKILKNFTIEFPYDFKKYISVFIGANGSGKSTILEAIAQIFSDTILNQGAKFGFELEYSVKLEEIIDQTGTTSEFNTAYILVKLYAEKNKKIKASVRSGMDDTDFSDKIIDSRKMVAFGQGKEKSAQSYLPDNIVIYYSGLSEIMENLCKPHEEKFSKAYRKGNTDIDRDFFYYKPEHFGIILLSLLSYEYGDIPEFLLNKAKIQGMQSVQIVLKEPYWTESYSLISDFWGASGNVRKFLDFVCHTYSQEDKYDFLDYSIIKKNVEIHEINDGKLKIIIKSQNALFTIKDFLGEERLLFEIFAIMLHDDFIDTISFNLIKEENEQTEKFSILSEGEQQEIAIKGMTELLSGKNTLFLFDEPDTYLHPSWQRQFIGEIEKEVERHHKVDDLVPENSYIIATHSPQLLSNARAELNFVKILENGELIDNTPNHYGHRINSVLYNLMGVPERPVDIQSDINKMYEYIEFENFKDAHEIYSRLLKELGAEDEDMIKAKVELDFLKSEQDDND